MVHRPRNPRALAALAPAVIALTAGCAMATEPASPATASVQMHESGPWVVDFIDGTSIEAARGALLLDTVDWFHPLAADDAMVVVDALTEAQHASLARSPHLEVLEPSRSVQALGVPDDPLYARQWNLHTVGAPEGWQLGSGSGVIVAVIDTGVSPVEDLAGTKLLEGASFVRGEKTSADGNGHGTHVAGTIAQTTNNGIGVASIAPGATILPLKALSATGSGTSAWVAAAIDEAGDQGAQIINMSLGGPRSEVIARAVEKAQRRGILVIAAAGNTGREGVGSPARLPGVVAVSATGPTDERAPYSTFGPEVVLSAPGGDKTQPGGGILQDTVSPADPGGHAYKEFQGTSMATPHVAGAAALIWGATAGGADHVRSVLVGSATDLGEAGHDPIFGHGRLDVAAATRHVALWERGGAFVFAGVLTWLLGGLLAPTAGRKRAAITASLVAGGIFFLPLVPGLPAAWTELLSRPLLLWADVVMGAGWSRSPLVLSAALPAVLTFVLGPTRTFGPWVAGISAGIGAHLLYGAATGSLAPTWITGFLGTGWLGLHGALAIICAAASLGVQHLRARQETSA